MILRPTGIINASILGGERICLLHSKIRIVVVVVVIAGGGAFLEASWASAASRANADG